MSSLFFNHFFQRYGVRSSQYLVSPRTPKMELFDFPKNSIHHFIPYDGVFNAPSSEEYLYRNIVRKILVNHVTSLADTKGNPRKTVVPVLPMIRDFHVKNRRFRYTEDIENIKDENSLVVINYGFATTGYRYLKTIFTEYYKWWNLEKTLWETIGSITKTSIRNHFIFLDVPKTLPSIPKLNIYSELFNQDMVRRFTTPSELFILEVWKWLNPETRKNSVMGDLSQEQLNKVNLVYTESGHFVVLNLGQLDSWIKTNEKTESKTQIDYFSLQKRFLRMLMSLMEIRTQTQDLSIDSDSEQDLVTNDDGTIEEPNKNSVSVSEDSIPVDSSDKKDLSGFSLDDGPELDSGKNKLEKLLNSLDDDLNALELIESKKEKEQQEQSDKDRSVKIDPTDKTVEFSFFNKERKPEDYIVEKCDELAEDGMISASEYSKFTRSASSWRSLASPFNPEESLAEFSEIKPEDLQISESKKTVDRKTITDKTMLSSSLLEFDERYITEIMSKDVVNAVIGIQNAEILITNYEVETVEDILGKYEIHSVRLSPVEGKPSTVRFKIPKVEPDGTYVSNSIKYRLRKQRGDLPIRKISPDTVSLTSYYGKTFVTRSDKKAYSYNQWFQSEFLSKGIDSKDMDVTNMVTANVFDNSLDLPRSYTTLASIVKSFTSGGFNFNFDYHSREKFFGSDNLKKLEIEGRIVIADNNVEEHIVMDHQGSIYKATKDVLEPIGTMESLLNIDTNSSPVDFAQIKIYGKNIPIVLILGYMYGLEKLIDVLKATVRRVPSGQRLNLQDNEYSVSFSDETLVFSKDDKLASIVFAGFKEYSRHIKNYSVYTFDKPNVYLNVLESNSIGQRYLRELDLMDKLFIDPITKGLLIEMGEPTTFRGLIVRSAQLLLKDSHPDALDMQFMRIKGYERFSGAIYSELVKAVREHNGKSGKKNYPIELNPYSVWKNITTDPSISLVSDINPIENLKQQESVTYAGVGGRMSRSMTKSARAYHPNDMGIISESTSDSSDVAINTYTSADPQFVSLRGRAKKYDLNNPNPTALLSTSALISVGSDTDDPKRVNFVGIQHTHGVACIGYKQSSVRTGYEQILAQRTSDLFAYSARQDGVVLNKTNNSILIQYEDGTKKAVELGRRFGAAAGLTIAHSVISDMQIGQTFKKGDIVSYNDGFFEKDILNPDNVIWKMGVVAKTVLWESFQTHEDSSSISVRLAKQLSTKITKVKHVVVDFTQEIKDILKPGTSLEYRTVLCTIVDSLTSSASLFDENTQNALRMFGNQTPQAKVQGVLEKIEVFYNGEKEDMSLSLRDIANSSDKYLASKYKEMNLPVLTGQVNEGFKIDGNPLLQDTLVIKFYMTTDVGAGVGDKGVFANQMKTVFGEVMDYEVKTETGEIIDAVFGQKSIDDRIVISALTIGTTNTLLDVLSEKAVQLYES